MASFFGRPRFFFEGGLCREGVEETGGEEEEIDGEEEEIDGEEEEIDGEEEVIGGEEEGS